MYIYQKLRQKKGALLEGPFLNDCVKSLKIFPKASYVRTTNHNSRISFFYPWKQPHQMEGG